MESVDIADINAVSAGLNQEHPRSNDQRGNHDSRNDGMMDNLCYSGIYCTRKNCKFIHPVRKHGMKPFAPSHPSHSAHPSHSSSHPSPNPNREPRKRISAAELKEIRSKKRCYRGANCTRTDCQYNHDTTINMVTASSKHHRATDSAVPVEIETNEAVNLNEERLIQKYFGIASVCAVTDKNKYIITDSRSGERLDVLENVCTKYRNEKIIHDASIWNSTIILGFMVDSGSDIGIVGTNVFNELNGKYGMKATRAIKAYAADKQKVHVLRDTLRVPIRNRKYLMMQRKYKIQKDYLQLWHMPDLGPNMLILGRDGMKTLGVAIYNQNDIKWLLQHHIRGKNPNIITDDENVDALFKAIEYRNRGMPGLYRIDNKSRRVSVFKGKIHTEQKEERIKDIMREKMNESKKETVEVNMLSRMEIEITDSEAKVLCNELMEHDRRYLRNAKEEYNAMVATIERAKHSKEQRIKSNNQKRATETGHNNQKRATETGHNNQNRATKTSHNNQKRATETGHNESNPQEIITNLDEIEQDIGIDMHSTEQLSSEERDMIFDQFTFGDIIDEKTKMQIKQRMIKEELFEVFSTHHHDIARLKVEPLRVIIKDKDRLRIGRHYDLNGEDSDIFYKEIEYFIAKKCAHWQRGDEIVVESNPGFVIHREMGFSDDGSVLVKSRLVNNLKHLNDNTYDYYYKDYESIDEVHLFLSQFSYFVSSDITKYFYGLPLEEDSKKYVGMSTGKGILIWDVVPHGIKNAPRHGQYIVIQIFKGTNIKSIVDDLYGGGNTVQDIIERLFVILVKAKKFQFKLGPKKTYIGVQRVDCGGFYVSKNGLMPLPRNTTKALSISFDKLTSVENFGCFEGMVIFISRWIKDLAKDIKHLKLMMIDYVKVRKIQGNRDLTTAQRRKRRYKTKLLKPKEARDLFESIIIKIENAPLLHFPDLRRDALPFVVKCDTSLYATGSSLWQRRGKYAVLIEFFSRALTAAQSAYSATVRECLGYCLSIRNWRKYLRINQFTLIGDHKPLLKLFNIDYETKNKLLLRFSIILSGFSFAFDYKKGTSLGLKLEDYMSRLPVPMEGDTERFKREGMKVPIRPEEVPALEPIEICVFTVQQEEEQYEEIRRAFGIRLISVDYDDNALQSETSALESEVIQDMSEKTVDINALWINEDEEKLWCGGTLPIDNETNCSVMMFKEACDVFSIEQHQRNALIREYPYLYPEISHRTNLMDKEQIFGTDIYSIQMDSFEEVELLRDIHHRVTKQLVPVVSMYNVFNNVCRNDSGMEQRIYASNIALEAADKHIYNMITRNKAKENELRAEFKPEKQYLFEPADENIFIESKSSPREVLYKHQQLDYKNAILYLQTEEDQYKQKMNIYDFWVFDLIKKNKVYLNKEGLLVYKQYDIAVSDLNQRLIIPRKLRVSLMQYYHTAPGAAHHRGVRVLVNLFQERFYWIDWREDVVAYCAQCLCRAWKQGKVRNTGVKDKGIMESWYCQGINDKVFMDLYGPLPDGNYIMVMVCGFSGFVRVRPLLPLFDITALGIVRFVMFVWCYTIGIPNQIINDNGSNLTAKLNKLFLFIFGIMNKKICSYSPWVNGKAEIKMKAITQAVGLDAEHRVILGLEDVYDALNECYERNSDYNDLCYAIELNHNNLKNQYTLFSANELLMNSNTLTVMDLNLKLLAMKQLKKEDYIKDNIIDFKKFNKLLNIQRRFIAHLAKKNNIAFWKKKRMESDMEMHENIMKNDYVFFKKKYVDKKHCNMKFGWVVTATRRKYEKYMFDLRNVFTGEIMENVNKGKITKFHKPLFTRPETMLQNEITRISELSEKEKMKKLSEMKED